MELRPFLNLAFKRNNGLEAKTKPEHQTLIKPEGWRMSDPRHHDPKNFRYIVTTTSKTSMEMAAQLSHARGEAEGPPPTEWEGLIAEMLARNSLSCTVIDENHRATFKQDVMPQALIIDVPPENIIGLDYTDLGVMYEIQDKAKRKNSTFFKQGAELLANHSDAQTFLEKCSSTFRNEVLIDSTGPQDKQIRVAGVIFFTDPRSGTPLYELHSRYSWHPGKVASRIWRLGDTDETYTVRRLRQEYNDTKDLAKLLQIPIIHMPTAA